MVKTISVKELRTNFPKVRKGLKKGFTYLVIYQSIPIGKLQPVDPENLVLTEASDLEVENMAIKDVSQDEYLTKKELEHYLSIRND